VAEAFQVETVDGSAKQEAGDSVSAMETSD